MRSELIADRIDALLAIRRERRLTPTEQAEYLHLAQYLVRMRRATPTVSREPAAR
jgi:hypothetical protein